MGGQVRWLGLARVKSVDRGLYVMRRDAVSGMAGRAFPCFFLLGTSHLPSTGRGAALVSCLRAEDEEE